MNKALLGIGKFKSGSVCSDLQPGCVFALSKDGAIYTTYETRLIPEEQIWEIKTLENNCVRVNYGSSIIILKFYHEKNSHKR